MTSGFTPLAIQLLQDRPSAKCLPAPTHIGRVGDEGGGDYVVAEFEVVDGVVRDYGYRCNGCPTTIACCEIIGRLAMGADFDAVRNIPVTIIEKLLGETADGKAHIPAFVSTVLSDFKTLSLKNQANYEANLQTTRS